MSSRLRSNGATTKKRLRPWTDNAEVQHRIIALRVDELRQRAAAHRRGFPDPAYQAFADIIEGATKSSV